MNNSRDYVIYSTNKHTLQNEYLITQDGTRASFTVKEAEDQVAILNTSHNRHSTWHFEQAEK